MIRFKSIILVVGILLLFCRTALAEKIVIDFEDSDIDVLADDVYQADTPFYPGVIIKTIDNASGDITGWPVVVRASEPVDCPDLVIPDPQGTIGGFDSRYCGTGNTTWNYPTHSGYNSLRDSPEPRDDQGNLVQPRRQYGFLISFDYPVRDISLWLADWGDYFPNPDTVETFPSYIKLIGYDANGDEVSTAESPAPKLNQTDSSRDATKSNGIVGVSFGGTDIWSVEVRFMGKVDPGVAIDDITFTIDIPGGGQPPVTDAGPNLAISSEDQNGTVICGTATDPDDDPLTYRWVEGVSELCTWQDVGPGSDACLDLSNVSGFIIGEHTLTLEVSDGQATSRDDMILIVENAAPTVAPTGSGVYEITDPVTLGGQVSDFDGDALTYDWLEGQTSLFTGLVQAIFGGDAVDLPQHTVYPDLGAHTLTLRVTDGINNPVVADIAVEVIDTVAPTLAPVPDKGILWPPNHKMVDITIEANAGDNSGGPVTLTAAVTSNEPEDGLGDGDKYPDWSDLEIDSETGVISLQLRAERSGSGDGRVYTVTIMATDESGNSSSADVKIIVPHDMRKKANQIHATHFYSATGPGLPLNETGCYVCHADGQLQCQGAPLFADGKFLADTTVCDPCHAAGVP